MEEMRINYPHTQLKKTLTADVSRQRASSRDGDSDTFVSYKWGRYEPVVEKPDESLIQPGKRIRIQRNLSNSLSALGKAYAATEGDEDDEDDENPTSGADPGGETAPESFKEAVEDPRWRESMQAEIKALRNRGVWRVIQTPQGVRLIKSKYVYRIKKDWTQEKIKTCRARFLPS